MASVAERSCGPLHVISRVVGYPPIGSIGDHVAAPFLIGDIPLTGQREIVVADLGEVALLPFAAVDESYSVFGEGESRIGLAEIRNDRVGMHFGIAHDVC